MLPLAYLLFVSSIEISKAGTVLAICMYSAWSSEALMGLGDVQGWV